MVTWPQLEAAVIAGESDSLLIPVTDILAHWPTVLLQDNVLGYIRQGQAIWLPKLPTAGLVKFVDRTHTCVGIGEVMTDGKVAPRKVFQYTA